MLILKVRKIGPKDTKKLRIIYKYYYRKTAQIKHNGMPAMPPKVHK